MLMPQTVIEIQVVQNCCLEWRKSKLAFIPPLLDLVSRLIGGECPASKVLAAGRKH